MYHLNKKMEDEYISHSFRIPFLTLKTLQVDSTLWFTKSNSMDDFIVTYLIVNSLSHV